MFFYQFLLLENFFKNFIFQYLMYNQNFKVKINYKMSFLTNMKMFYYLLPVIYCVYCKIIHIS